MCLLAGTAYVSHDMTRCKAMQSDEQRRVAGILPRMCKLIVQKACFEACRYWKDEVDGGVKIKKRAFLLHLFLVARGVMQVSWPWMKRHVGNEEGKMAKEKGGKKEKDGHDWLWLGGEGGRFIQWLTDGEYERRVAVAAKSIRQQCICGRAEKSTRVPARPRCWLAHCGGVCVCVCV